jgi:hypothetical protein
MLKLHKPSLGRSDEFAALRDVNTDDAASLKLVTNPAARMATMPGSSLTTHLSLEAFVKTHNADDHPFVNADIVACLRLERNGAAFHAQNRSGCGHPEPDRGRGDMTNIEVDA